jgi:hypothetical protein
MGEGDFLFSPSAALILHSCYTGCPGVERMLLPRMAADDGAGRPCLIPIPRLLVGLAAGKCASECEWPAVARSPTSPLDLWAFLAFGGALARSPRSWDSHRVVLSSCKFGHTRLEAFHFLHEFLL